MAPKPTLLASSDTFEQIVDAVARYYCGEHKDMRQEEDGYWTLRRAEGSQIEGMRVVLKKRGGRKRYRFETTLF